MDNEHNLPEGEMPAGGISVPKIEKKPFFFASKQEKIAAFLMFIAAYIYTMLSGEENWEIWLAVFTALFVGMTELIHWERRRTWESWVWLGCVTVIFGAIVAGRGDVWGGHTAFFLHVFAVWWVLVRSGALLEGESGRLLVIDAVNGFIIFPFKHFILRFRCVVASFYRERREEKRANTDKVGYAFLAIIAALVLFIIALGLLIRADEGFGELVYKLGDAFTFQIDGLTMLRVFLSLPIGAYLFGLIAGTGREDKERLRERGRNISVWFGRLHRVPSGLWVGVAVLFAAVYAVFFAVQGSYLFGAFFRKLTEGFAVAEYARQGFFELCRVMAVNFTLLWCIARTGERAPTEHMPSFICCLVLLFESLLFAVVAASKLWLYIDCFGFTPRRLQSAWLVCALFAGCVAFGYHITTGRKSMRLWIIFCAVTLSLLCWW